MHGLHRTDHCCAFKKKQLAGLYVSRFLKRPIRQSVRTLQLNQLFEYLRRQENTSGLPYRTKFSFQHRTGTHCALSQSVHMELILGKSVLSNNTCGMLSSSGPTLTCSEVSHSLRTSAMSRAFPVLSTQRKKSPTAILMEPMDLSENSLLEFGRLAEELNQAPKPPRLNYRASSHSSNRTETKSVFPSTVGEALTTHAKHRRTRSLEDTERMMREMIPLHKLRQGGFVENCLIYRQIFVIRSYEVGADKTSSINTIFSLFQEVALCHVHLLGIAGDGFGATRGMNSLGLIWVVTRMQVEVERYPCWPEVIEIDSWVAASGKNGMRRDWVMRCYQTGEVIARATSTWCMMHATTRRLSKIPEEVRAEIEPCFMENRFAFQQAQASSRITKLNNETTELMSSQLKSSRADLDMNQHVNNLKYIDWVLESVPVHHIENYDLTSMTLEYRRECKSADIVESLTSSKSADQEPIQINEDQHACGILKVNEEATLPAEGFWDHECAKLKSTEGPCQMTHLLHTQGAQEEILRGRTTWRPRVAL